VGFFQSLFLKIIVRAGVVTLTVLATVTPLTHTLINKPGSGISVVKYGNLVYFLSSF